MLIVHLRGLTAVPVKVHQLRRASENPHSKSEVRAHYAQICKEIEEEVTSLLEAARAKLTERSYCCCSAVAAMLMRSSTRIEFRVEDAQEYIKARERQKRPGQGHTCTLPPVPGASREDDAYPTSRSSTAMSPIDRAPSAEEEVEEAQPSRTESAHHEVSEPDHFQSEAYRLSG
eukprot:g24235.t1